MRKLTLAAGMLVAAALTIAWLAGWIDGLTYSAIGAQREFQSALAAAIGRLKAAEPGATLGLVGLCFGYGVLHAAGPGHGKMLVGGYALANRVEAMRLVAIAVAASLAQAATAVVLVYAGVLLFSWTSKQMVGMAEQSMTVASYAAIGAIGLFVGARGLKALAAAQEGHGQAAARHAHDAQGAHLGHGDHAGACGHSHGPDLASVEGVRTLRDALPLIAAVAVRPCTGAIFLLILCWRIGANAAGVAGTFAMGLGTAVVTVGAAFLAATMREGAWATGLDSSAMRRVMGGVGVLVGLILVATSALMLRAYL